MPKVSVVLPTYNGQKYIKESIESIRNQSFKDWELIIVNDCSTDDTQKIIQEYLDKDIRIKEVVNAINQKLPNSLNIGFSVAKGEYFTWTSDDNIYKENALESMANFLDEHHDAYMVCARMNIIDKNDKFMYSYHEYNEEKMLINNCVGACFMYRKCVFEDVGQYNPMKFLVEDYDYWLRILFYYGKIDYIPDILYMYRVHEASLTDRRKKDIFIKQLALKKEYIRNITSKLRHNKDLLCQIYYELKENGFLGAQELSIFYDEIPELKNEISMENVYDKIIIYGAGEYGRRAYERYKKEIKYYADAREELEGRQINGIKIISISEMLKLKSKYQIMIAAHSSKRYSFIDILSKNNVKKYMIFYSEKE